MMFDVFESRLTVIMDTFLKISSAYPVKNHRFALFLKKFSGLGLKTIVACLADGADGVFYECRLYYNDHEEHETQVRAIFGQAEIEGITLAVQWVETSTDAKEGTCADVEWVSPAFVLEQFEQWAEMEQDCCPLAFDDDDEDDEHDCCDG